LGFEIVERSEGLLNGSLERAILENTTIALSNGSRRGEDLPEEGVVDMT